MIGIVVDDAQGQGWQCSALRLKMPGIKVEHIQDQG